MSLMQAVSACYAKYATFQGRACRSEFWYFVLFQILAIIALMIGFTVLSAVAGEAIAATIAVLAYLAFALGSFLPSLAVRVRRLHDTNRSGWLMFIVLIPLVGPILMLVWDCQRGTHGANRYGEDPLPESMLNEFGPAPGRSTP